MWLSRCRILTLAPLSCTFGHVHPSKDFNSQPRASPSPMPPPNLSCNIAQDLRVCPTPDCGNNSSTGHLQEQPLHLLPDPVPPPVRSPLPAIRMPSLPALQAHNLPGHQVPRILLPDLLLLGSGPTPPSRSDSCYWSPLSFLQRSWTSLPKAQL